MESTISTIFKIVQTLVARVVSMLFDIKILPDVLEAVYKRFVFFIQEIT